MKRPNINLHIDELVLHGFAAGDRYAIADAVQSELSRLLSLHSAAVETRFSPANRSIQPRVDAGTFQVTLAQGHSIGVQIAQAVHGGLVK